MAPIVVKIAFALGFSAFEYWLGKTKTVKPNSTVDLAVSLAKRLSEILLKGKKL